MLSRSLLAAIAALALWPVAEAKGNQYSGEEAISLLNEMRAARGLPEVEFDEALSARCENWAIAMNDRLGLQHDRRVYGTEERENIAGGQGFKMTHETALRMWNQSPPHANAMYDRSGFPRAVRAGYGEYKGFACLRLCPKRHQEGVCD